MFASLPASPPLTPGLSAINLVEVPFSPNQRPRNKLKQHGGHQGLMYTPPARPYLEKLREFEQIALYDSTVSFALFALIDTLIAMLGAIEHPDPEIQAYLRNNINRLGGLEETDTRERRQTILYQALFKMLHCAHWAGFSTTEVLYANDKGTLYIDDFVTYHPGTIIVRPNVKGRLVEGEPSNDWTPSGIYQMTEVGEKLLPLWKVVHLCRNEFYGNYYGLSAIEPIYKWHLLKEAFVDMRAVALDRFGNPILAITVPVYNTNQREVDPNTGEERILTTQEVMERQISSSAFAGGGNVLLLPQLDGDVKPEVKVLTTGNDVGASFQRAIEDCDREMSKGLLVPYALMNATEPIDQRQMELFNRIINSVYRNYITPILAQSFHRLIQMSFTRESAKVAPRFPIRQTSRPEDRVALMQVITGLTDKGFFNPTNYTDWKMVREMVDAQDRDPTKADVEFVKQMLVYPRQKEGATTDPSRDRTNEGKVQGTGSGSGRPVGTAAPKQVADPVTGSNSE